jgi:translocation and assembly module TamA
MLTGSVSATIGMRWALSLCSNPMPWQRILLWLPLLLLLLAAGSALAEVPYVFEITGVADKALRGELEANADLVKLKARPPASETALRRRAEADVERLKQIVEAAGYRAATLDYTVDLEATPAKVTLVVQLGPLYHLESIALTTADGRVPPIVGAMPPDALGLKRGAAASSTAVLAAEPRIVEALTRRGHPFAKVAQRKVVVDHGTQSMSVTFIVEAGPPARFGPTAIDGLKQLDRPYVERRIAWRRGQPFDARLVEETHKTLVESGLFNVVRIDQPTEPQADGEAAMSVNLVERLPRSVGAGVSYDTSEGFGAKAFWEHRNLFGGGQKLRFSLDLAESRLGGSVDYREPDIFGRHTQTLLASAEIAHETPVAYTSQRERVFGGLEHRFSRALVTSGGLQLERGDVTEEARGFEQTYTLLGVPLQLKLDTTDDLLDPSRGQRATLTTTPQTSLLDTPLSFLSTRLTGSTYHRLGETDRYTLAAFGALGLVGGERRDALPADKRLYAGGGGSLRGYGYQLAGPLGPDDKPLGGRSSLELGAELRIKITDTIGIVPFVDVGNVFTQTYPDFRDGLLYDAGIGARYYTPIGPIRLDIATPLRRRSGDAVVQIYISIGQAF